MTGLGELSDPTPEDAFPKNWAVFRDVRGLRSGTGPISRVQSGVSGDWVVGKDDAIKRAWRSRQWSRYPPWPR